MLIALLALIGLALIFTEFFLPGGILAVIGAIALLISSILCFMQTTALWGILFLILLIAALIGTCQLALRKIRKSGAKNRFYLEKDQEGYVAAAYDAKLIGKTGVVWTELKPAGHILVEGAQHQALSEVGFLSKGETVEIVGGQGSHLIVRTPQKRPS